MIVMRKLNQIAYCLRIHLTSLLRASFHAQFLVVGVVILVASVCCDAAAEGTSRWEPGTVRRSTDAGLTLDPPVFVRPTVGTNTHSSSIHLAPDGSVLVASPEFTFSSDRIDIHRSTDGAFSFSRVAQLAVGGAFEFLAYAQWNAYTGDSTILVSWVDSQGRLQLKRSLNNGATFEPTVQLSGPSAIDSAFVPEHEFARTASGT